MNVYHENGYEDREEYLRQLADDNGADYDAVLSLAEILGPEEDFDGLRVAIEDWDWE